MTQADGVWATLLVIAVSIALVFGPTALWLFMERRARAIATEAHRAETVEQGSVHEGAGPQDIAQGPSQ